MLSVQQKTNRQRPDNWWNSGGEKGVSGNRLQAPFHKHLFPSTFFQQTFSTRHFANRRVKRRLHSSVNMICYTPIGV